MNEAARAIALLKEQNLTLATAESCTGGLLGKLLTDVAGSSAVYLGGVISYAYAETTCALSGCGAAFLVRLRRNRTACAFGTGGNRAVFRIRAAGAAAGGLQALF